MGPASTSRTAALSRTERVSTWRETAPDHTSPWSGPTETRPREGLSPTRPQADAGMRSDPPPSPPCPTGTIPAATAAALPPLDPPTPRSGSQGLRVGPQARGSVNGSSPNSGVLVLPTGTNPAPRSRVKRWLSWSAVCPSALRSRFPWCKGAPAREPSRSFATTGTPWNGPGRPSGGPAATALRAASKSGWITAFSAALRASMRAIAAWTSSAAVTSPARTSAAWAVASRSASSSGTGARYRPTRSPRPGRAAASTRERSHAGARLSGIGSLNIYFDVDYTILGPDQSLRPHTHDVFARLIDDGHRIFVWSGEGQRWEVVRGHDLERYVSGVYEKPIYDYEERLSLFGITEYPDFIIDDYPEIVRVFGGIKIPWYAGAYKPDDVLPGVYDAIKEFAETGTSTHPRFETRVTPHPNSGA